MRSLIAVFLITLFFTSCAKVELPQERIVKDHNSDSLKSILPVYPKDKVPYQNIANKNITYVKEGEKNLYGITITKDLKSAYEGYLSGKGDEALKALENIKKSSKDKSLLWQASFLKVQTLIMMGLGDDALDEISTCSSLEKEVFKSDLNCIALRAELKVWLEDYEGAKKDASDVLLTIGEWEFPVAYPAPPSNMPTLVATTTAQLRAYTSLAALYNLKEDYKESYYFANEAEKRMNSIHFVSNHWLYGKFVNLHLDSYYGRATNLVFLGASKLALGYSEKEAEEDFKKAVEFFEMIKYKKGIATVLALKARVYNTLGMYDRCNEAGKIALDFALDNGFLDFVWRIEAIRGDTFLNLGLKKEAQKAYKRANETINLLSGALSNESAKRRFGIGKDDIVYNLIKFDIEDKNYKQLFLDLEQNRARAFVDMLSLKAVALNRDNKILKDIQNLDRIIKRQSLINSSSSASKKGIEELDELLRKRKIKENLLQHMYPKIATAVSIWSSTLKETRANLQTNESMIYFLPLKKDEKLSFLKITKDKLELKTLGITSNDLQKELSKLSTALGIKDLLSDSSKRALKLKKNSVVNKNSLMVESLEETIDSLSKKLDIKTIFDMDKTYIIPSGLSHFIPWGMFETNKEFTTLPNGSWINHKDIKLNVDKDIVIVANPDFKGTLPQLKGAQAEGEAIAVDYGADLLKLEKATELNLRDMVKKGTDILHLATHGVFFKHEPLKSSIYLSGEKKAEPLSAKKIFEQPIPSNLVILSACETGLGKSSSGDDLLGLTRSFFLGGTKTVLSSLWAIDDEGTKEFMVEFHKYAKSGKYSKGFLKARQKLKQKGYSPAIYGAFVLNGLDK